MMKTIKDTKDSQTLKKICKCGCSKLFTPKREWQKFYNPEHQKEYWRRIQNDKVYLLKRLEEIEKQLKSSQAK